mmetsp:Transcript_6761/g.7690  ORF Transcript_6761/g.7690 Transcript_6761/m.7690 type:complete len:322 (+) Transcript_6761:39-1004(+)
MYKNNTKHTPLKRKQRKLAASPGAAGLFRLYNEDGDDDDDSVLNDGNNDFPVAFPVEQHTGTLFAILAGTRPLELRLDTIHQLIVKIIKEHGGNSRRSKPSDQFLIGFNRSATIYALHQVIRAIIERVDSAGNESIVHKRIAIFDNVFHLFNLVVTSDTREISITIAQAIIDSLTTECAKIFCDDQVGENRIGYVKYFPEDEAAAAIDTNDFVAKSLFFVACKILPAYPTIGNEHKNKAVTLIASLSGRIQENKLDFFIAGAVEKAGKLVMFRKMENTFLSKVHVKVLMTMMKDITNGATIEAEDEAAAEAEEASANNGTN